MLLLHIVKSSKNFAIGLHHWQKHFSKLKTMAHYTIQVIKKAECSASQDLMKTHTYCGWPKESSSGGFTLATDQLIRRHHEDQKINIPPTKDFHSYIDIHSHISSLIALSLMFSDSDLSIFFDLVFSSIVLFELFFFSLPFLWLSGTCVR